MRRPGSEDPHLCEGKLLFLVVFHEHRMCMLLNLKTWHAMTCNVHMFMMFNIFSLHVCMRTELHVKFKIILKNFLILKLMF